MKIYKDCQKIISFLNIIRIIDTAVISYAQLFSSLLGFYNTMSENSFCGAIIISCFKDLILMKVMSSSGWIEFTVNWALVVNWLMSDPYSRVSFWDIVLLIAIPLLLTIITPYTNENIHILLNIDQLTLTPLWVFILFRVSSTCDYITIKIRSEI